MPMDQLAGGQHAPQDAPESMGWQNSCQHARVPLDCVVHANGGDGQQPHEENGGKEDAHFGCAMALHAEEGYEYGHSDGDDCT